MSVLFWTYVENVLRLKVVGPEDGIIWLVIIFILFTL